MHTMEHPVADPEKKRREGEGDMTDDTPMHGEGEGEGEVVASLNEGGNPQDPEGSYIN